MNHLAHYINIRKGPSIIQATDDNILSIVRSEIKKLGKNANLNHIDVSKCTMFVDLFKDTDFKGDVSKWNMSNILVTRNMFKSCKDFNCDLSEWSLDSIKDAYCMFAFCYSLTTAPELPVTDMKEYCYSSMFYRCSSLKEAPELPATTLTESCYSNMFWGCKLLIEAPELPATTLTESCYSNMFRECRSLTQAPELPATTLAIDCYRGMFEECTSLKEMPKIAAKNWNDVKYSKEMFLYTKIHELTK